MCFNIKNTLKLFGPISSISHLGWLIIKRITGYNHRFRKLLYFIYLLNVFFSLYFIILIITNTKNLFI
jgi:hypothetical protein